MSILQSVRSLFFRNKNGEPSDANIPKQPSAEQLLSVSPPSPPPPDNVIYIYSHGFTNGVYRIEPDEDSFDRFLEFCSQVDRIKELRVFKEKAIADAETRLTSALAAYDADSNMLIEKGRLAEHLSLSLTELRQQRLKKDQAEAALATQVKETMTEYAWVPALFYFVAGIVFIVADISITRQITSWGFSMSGMQSWIFAIGLAFTAFLIKPTVDRLLEKPFLAAGLKLKGLYKWVLFGITVVGLTMLFVLGKFRSDSEIASRKINDLNIRIGVLDPNSSESREMQAQCDVIQKSLDENVYGQSGLIMSGMLFAIGGAICLSISFGALKQLINRYWILPFRIRRIKKDVRVLEEMVADVRAEHTTVKTDHEKAERSLAANDISLYKDDLNKLQEERSVLLYEFYEAQHGKERALYNDGKSKGGKYLIEGDLVYKTLDNDHSSIYLGKQKGEDEGQSQASPRSYTRRPFVKMRKMIADNFNKNQNNSNHDGSEFEIVS